MNNIIEKQDTNILASIGPLALMVFEDVSRIRDEYIARSNAIKSVLQSVENKIESSGDIDSELVSAYSQLIKTHHECLKGFMSMYKESSVAIKSLASIMPHDDNETSIVNVLADEDGVIINKSGVSRVIDKHG